MAKKERIDVLMAEKGLAESRSQAQRLVMAGSVRVDDQIVVKASRRVDRGAVIEVLQGPPYVSRGGEKLAAALDAFKVDVSGKVCADVGASTGGFTDCLLQAGAGKVYAIDVGYGVLHWKLRNNPHVVVMERTNARLLETLPEDVAVVTVDASFISLTLLLPVIQGWLLPDGDLIALIKPQFEAGPERLGRGGVVRDEGIRRDVLYEILSASMEMGFQLHGLHRSPLKGPKGNVEFLMWCRLVGEGYRAADLIEPLFSP